MAVLLGAKFRSKYSDLRVYAYATPAGLISREAARYTESFVFTIGVGDDFVMRLSIESAENLRTSIIETLRACKFPKWRIMLNGVGYVFFGVPSRDLEKTWKDVTDIESSNKETVDPLLEVRHVQTIAASNGVSLTFQFADGKSNWEIHFCVQHRKRLCCRKKFRCVDSRRPDCIPVGVSYT